jgi:acetyl-CoA decarbonylase/synthase complex subunit beta
MGEVSRVLLYSAFGYPHTSCGCFEGIAFYIPDVEGFGIVHRAYRDLTVNGLAFSTMADSTAGGRQVEGFHGISIEYMRSRKFLQGDGGYSRVVWVPSEIKERLREYIPPELYDTIATEKDAATIEELKQFLAGRNHPVTTRWEKKAPAARQPPGGVPVITAGEIPITTAGFRIILKNAKIYAEKVIIQPVNPKNPKRGEGSD